MNEVSDGRRDEDIGSMDEVKGLERRTDKHRQH